MTAADSRYRGVRGILGAFGTPAAGTMLFLREQMAQQN